MSIAEDIEKEEGVQTEEKKEKGQSILEKIFNAESPNKELSEYREHVLNWDNKDSTSRLIRGTEGIIGSLDKAVIDIFVGVIQKVNELFKTVDKGDGRRGN